MSTRALVQRINRKLRALEDGSPGADQVRAARSERSRQDVGEYFLLDVNRNWIKRTHLDLEAFGRELGVLAEWERLEE